MRLIAALLAEIGETWQEKIYFDIREYEERKAEKAERQPNRAKVA